MEKINEEDNINSYLVIGSRFDVDKRYEIIEPGKLSFNFSRLGGLWVGGRSHGHSNRSISSYQKD